MDLNRRDFLKLSSVAVAGTLSLSPESSRGAASSDEQLALLYDASKCIGCRACQMACKRWNNLPAETGLTQKIPAESETGQDLYDAPLDLTADTWTLIKVNKVSDTEWHFMNYQCHHCVDAACVIVCPPKALYKDPRGFTGYDIDKCIGCGYCTQFCPYGVPHLKFDNLVTGEAKAAKCTFCQDRIYDGLGGPFCAETCPVGALIWGPAQELLEKARARVATLHDQGQTSAMLYGENEAGGLRRLTILFGEPADYHIPTELPALTLSHIWQDIIQPVAMVSFGIGLVSAAAAWFVARRHIRMQDVD